jgi:hypothetical protein
MESVKRESGSTTIFLERQWSYIKTGLNSMGSLREEKRTDMGKWVGRMAASMTENGKTTSFMAKENMSGVKEEFLAENGLTIIWMAKECTLGQMEQSMKDSS